MKKEVNISTAVVLILLVLSLIVFFSSASIVKAAPPVCGDNKCIGQESCSSCPQDCGSCPSVCGDGTCDSGESCSSCSQDCGACPSVCGDGSCDSGESCSSCSSDCGSCPSVCGDGSCDSDETCSSCSSDCGSCPPTEFCGDGSCDADETCSSCSSDCGACPPGGGICGDGTCDADESCSSCSSDCGSCPGGGDTGGTTTTTEGTSGEVGPIPIKIVPENPKDGDTIKRGVLTVLVKGFRGKHLDSDLKITAESVLFGTIKLVDTFRGRYGRYVANAANAAIGKDVEKGEYAIVIKGDKGGAYDEERILINVDPTIYTTTSSVKEEYFKGERIVFTGNMTYFNQEPVKNVTTQLTISAEDFFLNKTIRTDLDGKFIDSYLISFAEPDGLWNIKIHATDEDGNEGSANLVTKISTPKGVAFYTVTFLSPPRDVEFKRLNSVPITVEVKEEGNLLENANVDFRTPLGDLTVLEEVRPGVYSGVYHISESDPLGLWYVSVQSLKTKDGITKAGGNRIPITISPAAMNLALIKPTATEFFTGQRIDIEAQLSYSGGIPVKNGNIIAQIGNKTVRLTERKPGIYTAHYLFNEKDVDVQSLQLKAFDIYGNSIALPPKAISVEAIGEYELKIRLFYYNVLLRYWYLIIAALVFLTIITQPLWHRAHLKSSLKKTVEDEKRTLEMQKDIQRKYFKHHSINQDDYHKLMLKYLERASDLKEKRLKIKTKLGKKVKSK